MIQSSKPLPVLAALLGLATAASAQQFGHISGAIPGANRWSEGVECADVDNDGDLDIFFADGEGFSSAGTQRPNVLIINRLNEVPAGFTDESTARLGTDPTNSKGVATGDIDGDGWIDALFANAFNTDPPSMYVNQGAGNPGFFTLESATRGFTEALSSAGAQFGDLDNDGDLDVIINDSGNSFLGGGGDEPRLFFNDGTGVFTENAAALGASAKTAQMDVQLVDIDNDWDLDFFGPCRAGNGGIRHYLMLNDGAGNFTDMSTLLPATSNNVYEAEVSDLDGDDDLDLFFVSLSGFSEGHMRNNLIGGGALGFTSGSGFSGDDDNEICLIDYDNDGDLDVFEGSLGSREKLFRNDGSLTWTVVNTEITAVGDPTLDCTAADLDNDGDYELLTSQGEGFPTSQWGNKLYRNNGGADTIPPVIVRTESLSGLPDPTGPWVVRGQVRDQVMDDGKNWVSAQADYLVLQKPLPPVSVSMQGFTFQPANITVPAGTRVTWDNPTTMIHTVTSSTAGYGFNSGQMNQGDSFSYTFIRPGVYDYFCIPHQGLGMVGTVTVTGNCAVAPATYSGGGIYRFEMTDTEGGLGTQLLYELRFTDFPGNASVTNSVSETIIDCNWVQYGIGVHPAHTLVLDASGSSEVGQTLSVDVTNVTGFGVLFVVGTAPANTPSPLGGVDLVTGVFTFALRLPNMGAAHWVNNLPADDPFLVGFHAYFQAAALITTMPDVWEFSNGLDVVLCPAD